MTRYIDCFLYNNEIELLSIRLSLLSTCVEQFVIAWSPYTFTGLSKTEGFPYDLPIIGILGDRVSIIEISDLSGKDAWQRESFSRDSLMEGLAGSAPDDVVIISDVDEIPRPAVLKQLSKQASFDQPIVLVQDYFNFKFNYQLMHGRDALWAGPVVQKCKHVTSLQSLRSQRWQLLKLRNGYVENAGWHFSFLTKNESVRTKLAHFSHQEPEVQVRGRNSIDSLIAKREGFNDHLHAGSVWAIRELSCLDCPDLESLVVDHEDLVLDMPADSNLDITNRIKWSIRNLYDKQLQIILSAYSIRELLGEIVGRMVNKIRSFSDIKGPQ